MLTDNTLRSCSFGTHYPKETQHLFTNYKSLISYDGFHISLITERKSHVAMRLHSKHKNGSASCATEVVFFFVLKRSMCMKWEECYVLPTSQRKEVQLVVINDGNQDEENPQLQAHVSTHTPTPHTQRQT